ncbi:MAG: hydroxyacid dehydrogenase [Streptococcaceae bacterium]|jgi:phosphoglycerate dehydrogenase-like enzyme|nr:hydroxyacid dehydrogenase [Streptococcaceae bacterium]
MSKIIYAPTLRLDIEKIKKVAPDYQVIVKPDTVDLRKVEIIIDMGEVSNQILQLSDNKLKWIQSLSAGVNYFDLPAIAAQNIYLTNTRGMHSVTISEHVILSIMFYNHQFTAAQSLQRSKKWDTKLFAPKTLEGERVLIFGTGAIGSELARQLNNHGAIPIGVNTAGTPVTHFTKTIPIKNYQEVLPTVDTVVNILPLTKATHHFYDLNFFRQLKVGTKFINVGRGASVITEDLIQALDEGIISFAALDVFEEEPLPVASSLWERANVQITPHMAGNLPNFHQRVLDYFLPNLAHYLSAGAPKFNRVDLKKGY